MVQYIVPHHVVLVLAQVIDGELTMRAQEPAPRGHLVGTWVGYRRADTIRPQVLKAVVEHGEGVKSVLEHSGEIPGVNGSGGNQHKKIIFSSVACSPLARSDASRGQPESDLGLPSLLRHIVLVENVPSGSELREITVQRETSGVVGIVQHVLVVCLAEQGEGLEHSALA